MTASMDGGRSGLSWVTRGGGSDKCAHSTAVVSSRGNGTAPVSIVYATQPRAYWSVCGTAGLLLICSGAQYSRVPRKCPVPVRLTAEVDPLARPKSDR